MLKSVYIRSRLFAFLAGIALLFIAGSFIPLLFAVAKFALSALLIAVGIDAVFLYSTKGIEGSRSVAERLSNGDDNTVYLFIKSSYSSKVFLEIIDELPFRFQKRDAEFRVALGAKSGTTLKYILKPVERGEYEFGNINVFAASPLQLLQRRYTLPAALTVKVYPSYIHMKKLSLMAMSDDLKDFGVKQIRKLGHNYEFDQIREFVLGDDYRSINWNATAKKNAVMVNQYRDEKSQDVYAVINKGRVMKMPFGGMTLLDYAVNSSLYMLNIAHYKDDNAGLITFNTAFETMVKAGSAKNQMLNITESLYNQSTDFSEANYELLYYKIRNRVQKRSLMFMYTNFESILSLRRELPFMKAIAKYHRLIVIFFRNTEMEKAAEIEKHSIEAVYNKTIASKFIFEKELIVRELRKAGIDSVLTAPEDLTVDTINKYLEIKKKHLM